MNPENWIFADQPLQRIFCYSGSYLYTNNISVTLLLTPVPWCRVCMAHGIVAKGDVVPCPVDAAGCFTPEITDFAGQHVKEADKGLIAAIKVTGRLYDSASLVHSYPFCWRSDTPLIYKVRVSASHFAVTPCGYTLQPCASHLGMTRQDDASRHYRVYGSGVHTVTHTV